LSSSLALSYVGRVNPRKKGGGQEKEREAKETPSFQHSESPLGLGIVTGGGQQVGPSMEEDFQAWLLDQALALRERRFVSLDVEHLAEELEDIAVLRQKGLRADLRSALLHMLKLAYKIRPNEKRRRERQWKLHLVEDRHRINDLLESSGTLRAECDEMIPQAYGKARKLAGLAIDPQQTPVGPLQCPWTREQILEEDFFPPSAASD
jgi:hypothetical protein